MAADLKEKTDRYKGLLRAALDDVRISASDGSFMEKVANDYLNLANCYYDDGVHFIEDGDLVNALVCFSYGHAWLDAGVRLGVFSVTKKDLFAA
ncbi:DUF357 domain-containing protein [Methanocella sp. CWC-04]|uniref:DUF357 domain-containing protein n=1 Tax=Methanooceanicella nereidis TaxID=2052831 RepID=A0AAP2REC1_9EURY|nr:DUF357 domain-containing protein [Methanocella sp. CWC-04]MCD1295788.1 DUF357 domain-containing protein [Methanocella sp. CWC-04]